jgi:hypothetical protein
MICPACCSGDVRRSRLNALNWARLLILQYPICCRSCGKRWTVGVREALKLRGPRHQLHGILRTLRLSYYVLSIAVSLAAFFASWVFCISTWGRAGMILGSIPSAVVSTLVLFLFLGFGRHHSRTKRQ